MKNLKNIPESKKSLEVGKYQRAKDFFRKLKQEASNFDIKKLAAATLISIPIFLGGSLTESNKALSERYNPNSSSTEEQTETISQKSSSDNGLGLGLGLGVGGLGVGLGYVVGKKQRKAGGEDLEKTEKEVKNLEPNKSNQEETNSIPDLDETDRKKQEDKSLVRIEIPVREIEAPVAVEESKETIDKENSNVKKESPKESDKLTEKAMKKMKITLENLNITDPETYRRLEELKTKEEIEGYYSNKLEESLVKRENLDKELDRHEHHYLNPRYINVVRRELANVSLCIEYLKSGDIINKHQEFLKLAKLRPKGGYKTDFGLGRGTSEGVVERFREYENTIKSLESLNTELQDMIDSPEKIPASTTIKDLIENLNRFNKDHSKETIESIPREEAKEKIRKYLETIEETSGIKIKDYTSYSDLLQQINSITPQTLEVNTAKNAIEFLLKEVTDNYTESYDNILPFNSGTAEIIRTELVKAEVKESDNTSISIETNLIREPLTTDINNLCKQLEQRGILKPKLNKIYLILSTEEKNMFQINISIIDEDSGEGKIFKSVDFLINVQNNDNGQILKVGSIGKLADATKKELDEYQDPKRAITFANFEMSDIESAINRNLNSVMLNTVVKTKEIKSNLKEDRDKLMSKVGENPQGVFEYLEYDNIIY